MPVKKSSYVLVVAAVFTWWMLLLLPPLAAMLEVPSDTVSAACYHFFSPICHQEDVRSLHLFGYKLGVCGRCFGIYTGFLVGSVLIPFFAGQRNQHIVLLWIVGVVPMVLDVSLDVLGFHTRTMTSRLLTGILFGAIAAYILVPLILEFLAEYFSRTSTIQGIHHESKT